MVKKTKKGDNMSKEFNGLNLKRAEIVTSIKNFCNIKFCEFTVDEDFEEKDKTRRRLNINGDGKDFYADFHFNDNGTTTIEDFGGKEVEIKKDLALFIKNDSNCKLGDESKNKWFVVKDIDFDTIISILELVEESDFCSEIISKDEEHKIYQYRGIYNEKLTIKYYRTKTVVLQGRPLLLFNEVMSMMVELIDLDSVPKLFNNYYKVKIKEDDILEQFNLFMPNASGKLPSKLKNTLLQAVYNSNLEGEMFDYTYLVFPAFRGLEGHLKYVLKDCEISLDDDRFNIFDKNDGIYYLKDNCKNELISTEKVEHIENLYNHLNDKRHVYFYWKYPNAVLDQTPIIENIHHARTLITDMLSLIDSYYLL